MQRIKNVLMGQDLIVIESDEDLKKIASELKSANCPDQNWDNYTKTNEDVNQLFDSVKGISTKSNLPYTAALFIDQEIYVVVLSLDSYYDKKWHLSMSRPCLTKTIEGAVKKMIPIEEKIKNRILNEFFSDWATIPNPGMINEIEHFIGND